MKRSAFCFAALMTVSVFAVPAVTQTHSGVDKFYILNCSEGIADDFSRWSPGVDSESRNKSYACLPSCGGSLVVE